MQRVIYHRILTHHPYAHTQKKAVSYRHCWGKRALQAGKDCKTLGEGEVVPLRFERGLREPKTLVLPLHHGTSTKGYFCSLQCKSTTSFPNNQILAHKKCSVQTKVDVNVGYTPSAEHRIRTKLKHQTLTLSANTNGGDASRVGKIKAKAHR